MLGYRDRIRGSLLGGAVGDALGAGIEFRTTADIRREFGAGGVAGFTFAYGHPAPITDDTQMTLFTAEGLIRSAAGRPGSGEPRAAVWRAYRRWLTTQGESGREADHGDGETSGWLVRQPVLHHRRAPGTACLTGLRSGRMGTVAQPANPGSKGCGAVMRSAPFGWLPWPEEEVWRLAVDCAVLTHGHPTGYLSAAAFAVVVRRLMDGHPLADAVEAARLRLQKEGEPGREADLALAHAVQAAGQGTPTPERVERLGGGWVGEEALAIAVYCALAADDVESALLAAVNHSGDSDSTGAITGNLLGTAHGDGAFPRRWVTAVEGRSVLLQVADDFAHAYGPAPDTGRDPAWGDRYPGC